MKSRELDGTRIVNTAMRKYCLTCSPFGNKRKKDRGFCQNCGKKLEGFQRKYCSISCSAKTNNKKRKPSVSPKKCPECGIPISKKSIRCKLCANEKKTLAIPMEERIYTNDRKNTKTIGEISEVQLMAKLALLGKVILRPFGDNQRYDLVIDDSGKFQRIQIKTGKLKNGVIIFNTQSSTIPSRKIYGRLYAGEIEFFGVYCPQNNKSYLVPMSIVGNRGNLSLRIEPTKNNQKYGSNWASDYELS
jgi:hypothetical protein